MKPTELRLRPEIVIPNIRLDQLIEYPELQRRINDRQFEVSGVHNLIVELKKEALEELKQEFISNNNSVNLEQFVWLISNSLQVSIGVPESFQNQYYQYEIEYELVKAFEEIDIDESDSISWGEYIQYITSSSLVGVEGGPDDQPMATAASFIKEVSYSHREKTSFRKSSIRKIVELEKQKMLAILEAKSDKLSFIGADGAQLHKHPNLQDLGCSKILSFDYCEEDRVFGVLLNTHRVIFIEDGEMQKTHGENKFSGDQVEIMYLRSHKLWALVSLNHALQIFKPPRGRHGTQNQHKVLFMFKPHETSLLGVKELRNPLSICTASMQGELKLWSLNSNQLLINIRPCKEEDFLKCKAIKGFQVYSKDSVSYLLCWMFSSEISVWLPSSSLSKPYLGKLKGHIGIVQQAKFFHNFPQAISIDNKHSVRVWEVSKLQCLQTWRLEANTPINLFILNSLPYALFFQKTIDFYKMTKEQDLINLCKAKEAMQKIQEQQKDKDNWKQTNSLAKLDEMHKKKSVKFNKRVTFKRIIDENDPLLSVEDFQSEESFIEIDSENQEEEPELNRKVIKVLYDDYFDCLVIMQPEFVKLVGINSGKILNTINTSKKQEVFVSISLSGKRKVFVANNFSQIGLYRLEDCSLLSKITFTMGFLPINSKITQASKLKTQHGTRLSIFFEQSQKNEQKNYLPSNNILAIDYNRFNNVLLVVGEIQKKSVLATYTNFSSLQPSKKKQIIFEQDNIHSFAGSQKFNMFFIASSRPELVTIWDYHNFIILKTIEFGTQIKCLSCDPNKFNILFVVSNFQIRALRLAPIDAKNNLRSVQNITLKDIVKSEVVMRSNQRILTCAFVMEDKKTRKNQKSKKKSKQKVHFEEEPLVQKPNNSSIKYGVYIARGDTISFVKLNAFIDVNQLTTQPIHAPKPNITREAKVLGITTEMIPQSLQSMSIMEMIIETIQSSKQNIDAMDFVKEYLYFSTEANVLNFYNPFECTLKAKLNLPNLEVIEWKICQRLVGKILERIYKAETTSKQIYSFKKNKQENMEELNYLRLVFFLNKYFSSEDTEDINAYFYPQGQEANLTALLFNSKGISQPISKTQKNILQGGSNVEPAKNFFHQRYEERIKMRSQASQKMMEIQKKYTRAFSYIKAKVPTTSNETPVRSIHKVSNKEDKNGIKNKPSLIKKSGSSSHFKIRNTPTSFGKMYAEQSKQIKECIKKIGIINRASGLKLE